MWVCGYVWIWVCMGVGVCEMCRYVWMWVWMSVGVCYEYVDVSELCSYTTPIVLGGKHSI